MEHSDRDGNAEIAMFVDTYARGFYGTYMLSTLFFILLIFTIVKTNRKI